MVESPRRGSLLVIFLTVFIDLLGFGMVLPLLPIYGEQFDASFATLGLLMASFSAMQFLFAPLWGRLSDRIGRRPVLLLGLAGSVVFYTLFGVATVLQSLTGLFIARIGAGVAGATISTAQAYIADSTSLENRAKGMALIGAAFGLGFTFGPLLGSLALPHNAQQPGPGPGYLAAALSAGAFALALFKLPESLDRSVARAAKHWLDVPAFVQAMRTPSIGPLLVAFFICILSFANFETTLSLLLKGETEGAPFHFDLEQVGYTFAYIGLTLTFAQGVLVRRMAGRVSEGSLASAGALLDMAGFLLLLHAISSADRHWMFVALSVIVVGFAFMMPSLNSLISRRSDPAQQGGILGVTQSVSSLARILGPMIGIPLFGKGIGLPYWLATGLMTAGLVLVIVAARGGRDFGTADLAEPVDLEL
ncbi:MAG TPA: MFS transporter [Pirellulales bacterium]|jgi:MFS family permease|nr:MFS transporter [Pirellulales bacterium]